MVWTLPVVIALVSLSVLFIFLAKVFNKDQKWIKVLFIMLSLGSCILIAQMLRIIVDANEIGTTLTNLQSMTTVALTISIVIFSFFVAYFLLSYTLYVIKGMKDAKKRRRFSYE